MRPIHSQRTVRPAKHPKNKLFCIAFKTVAICELKKVHTLLIDWNYSLIHWRHSDWDYTDLVTERFCFFACLPTECRHLVTVYATVHPHCARLLFIPLFFLLPLNSWNVFNEKLHVKIVPRHKSHSLVYVARESGKSQRRTFTKID